jgi:transposase
MSASLGIDISKRTFEVALASGHTWLHADFANTPDGFVALQAWLATHSREPVHACLEATGRYGLALATALYEAGHTVSIVNPKIIKAFAATLMTRNKTDRLDARLIGHYGQLHQPPAWSPPDPARDRLRQLQRYATSLQKQRQAERNRLQAGPLDPFVANTIRDHLAYLDRQLSVIQAEIEAHLQAQPALQAQRALLDSLPGIGPKAAAQVLAEIPDVRRLDHAGQLVAYAGINPQQHQSGTSVRKRTTISKQGNARLRTALFFPAMVAMTHAKPLQPFVMRLRQQGLPPKAIILAVMRKLLRWIYGVLKHQRPFDPAWLSLSASTA